MTKPPRILISTVSFDTNICHPGGTTGQDLISLCQIEALIIEEYLPAMLASYYYYSMLWGMLAVARDVRISNSLEAP